MATRMNAGLYAAKEKLIDDLENQFVERVKMFTSDAKTRMRSVSREAAMQVFEFTLVFLTQVFPDLSRLESASDDAISEKLSGVEEKASSFQKKVENDLEKLNKSKESHTHQILGLRKLQKLLCDKTKISQTVTATTPTSSLATASKALGLSLSHKSTFSGKCPIDTNVPSILDMKLLPGGLVILADSLNNCVKLFNLQGRHIYNQALDSRPFRMAVMDITFTPNGINIKTSMKTSKKYLEIAAVTTQTLAVGFWPHSGIDLIDLSGRILRQLSSTLSPLYMVTTADGYLMMSIFRDNSIAKLKLEDTSTFFHHTVQQIEKPRGVEFIMDGSFIIADGDKRTLNLISPDGAWVKNLWTHPGVAATPCGPPKSFSQRSTFSVNTPCDSHNTLISDMKLLPSGLALLANQMNDCVKLYNWQGLHIHTQTLEWSPCFMTVMDRKSQSSWDLCVTLPSRSKISLLGVAPNGVNIKTSIKTLKKYLAIAAVTTQTLAVGFWSGAGIDLIDLSGRILRQLSSALDPSSMMMAADEYLLMSIPKDNSIAKLKLKNTSTVFNHKDSPYNEAL
ncbi:hypothetical protein RRG08_000216 [Elysia crispata]|uniref:Uncharacterized protein n=1 Tax=Elysia crispata TaxID=231223 RepID=A0AAE0YWN7_9GAST|nr:hypothetical protein RRG08_000216 [Elysia crispata]